MNAALVLDLRGGPEKATHLFDPVASRVESTDFPYKLAVAKELLDGRIRELLRIEQRDEGQLELIDALFALHFPGRLGQKPHCDRTTSATAS